MRSWTTLAASLAVWCAAGSAIANAPFGSEHWIRPSDGASSVAVADFDRDGVTDLAYTAIQADTVTVWLSSNPAVYRLIKTDFDRACYLVVADVNGDGDVDLVAAKRGTGDDDVRWFENPRSPTAAWTEHLVSGTHLAQALAVDAADFDGDGDVDIVVAGENDYGAGVLRVFNNLDGAGTSWSTNSVLPVNFLTAHSVRAVDVDGDGDLDLVAAAYGDDKVAWFENDGSPWVGPWAITNIETGFDGVTCVATGDLDADGDPDVIAGAYTAGEVKWFENRVDQGMSWDSHAITYSFEGVYTVQAADLDLDGALDVLASSRELDRVTWFGNLGTSWAVHDVDLTFDGARSAVAVDFDRDGDLDVIAAAEFDDDISWWENLSNHRAAVFPEERNTLSGGQYVWVEVADVDMDGSPDIVAGAYNNHPSVADVVFATYDGGVWSEHVVDSALAGTFQVHVADVNGDSLSDLVAVGSQAGSVRWYQGMGDGVFLGRTLASGLQGSWTVATADFDGDGDLDVVVPDTNDDLVAWFENLTGDGETWARHDLSPGVDEPRIVWAGDFDHDGDADVVVGTDGGTVKVYRNTGTGGGWTPTTVATGLTQVRSLDVADVDADGWPDVLVTSIATDTVALILNEGPFTRYDVSTSFDGPQGARFADVNRDGQVDIVAAGALGNRVSWWRNRGSGVSWNGPYDIVTGLENPFQVAVSDLDSDGNPDVVVAAGTDEEVNLYSNRGGQFFTLNVGWAPAVVGDGEMAAFFRVLPAHEGSWDDDLDMEMRVVWLTFEDGAGTPLTSTQANDIVDRVQVWADVDGGDFDPLADALLVSDETISLTTGGRLQVDIPHHGANPRVGYGDLQAFFIVLQMTPDASSHTPSTFQVKHGPGAMALVRYYDHPDHSLRGSPWSTATEVVTISGGETPLFADGFESGNTSRWSSAVP